MVIYISKVATPVIWKKSNYLSLFFFSPLACASSDLLLLLFTHFWCITKYYCIRLYVFYTFYCSLVLLLFCKRSLSLSLSLVARVASVLSIKRITFGTRVTMGARDEWTPALAKWKEKATGKSVSSVYTFVFYVDTWIRHTESSEMKNNEKTWRRREERRVQVRQVNVRWHK